MLILIFLWLFQIVFLDSFYQKIKTENIKSCANVISTYIDNENFSLALNNLAIQNSLCIRIFDSNLSEIYSAQSFPDCIIHRISYEQLQGIYISCQKSTNPITQIFNMDYIASSKKFDRSPENSEELFNNKKNSTHFYNIYNPFESGKPFVPKEVFKNLVLAQLLTDNQGKEYLLLLNSNITPINSTVETLRIQLIIITIILAVFSIILSIILSKRLSDPIITTNNTAKQLAKGNYDIDFIGSNKLNNYKEISELNRTLNYATSELAQVDKLRRDLIANISHDLRTPLTMIQGYSEMMRDIPGENTPDNLQIVIDETIRLTNLVNDILDLSQIQSGSQKLTLKNFNLTKSIKNILKRYSKLIRHDGYTIKFDFNVDVYVNADEIKISQVIYNLINNAVNYTGDDKLIKVNQILKNGIVRIEVVDSGEGIDPQKINYIWDRYYKIDKTHKRAVIGTGIGLSIVKSILEVHNANYGVINNIDRGTTFWFELKTITF